MHLDFTWTSPRTNRTPGLWPWSRVSPCPKNLFHWGNQDLENLGSKVSEMLRNSQSIIQTTFVRLQTNSDVTSPSANACKQQPQARKVLLPVNLSKSLISISVNQYPPVVPQLFRDIQGRSSHWGLGLPRKPFKTPCRAPSRPPAEIFTGKMGHKIGQISGKMTQNAIHAIHKASPAGVWSLVAQPALLHESRRNPPSWALAVSIKNPISVWWAQTTCAHCSHCMSSGTSVLWSYEMPKAKTQKYQKLILDLRS